MCGTSPKEEAAAESYSSMKDLFGQWQGGTGTFADAWQGSHMNINQEQGNFATMLQSALQHQLQSIGGGAASRAAAGGVAGGGSEMGAWSESLSQPISAMMGSLAQNRMGLLSLQAQKQQGYQSIMQALLQGRLGSMGEMKESTVMGDILGTLQSLATTGAGVAKMFYDPTDILQKLAGAFGNTSGNPGGDSEPYR